MLKRYFYSTNSILPHLFLPFILFLFSSGIVMKRCILHLLLLTINHFDKTKLTINIWFSSGIVRKESSYYKEEVCWKECRCWRYYGSAECIRFFEHQDETTNAFEGSKVRERNKETNKQINKETKKETEKEKPCNI